MKELIIIYNAWRLRRTVIGFSLFQTRMRRRVVILEDDENNNNNTLEDKNNLLPKLESVRGKCSGFCRLVTCSL